MWVNLKEAVNISGYTATQLQHEARLKKVASLQSAKGLMFCSLEMEVIRNQKNKEECEAQANRWSKSSVARRVA